MKLMIFTSDLTNPPRYYASTAYKDRGNGNVVITGKKHDLTDQVEAIVAARTQKYLDQLDDGAYNVADSD